MLKDCPLNSRSSTISPSISHQMSILNGPQSKILLHYQVPKFRCRHHSSICYYSVKASRNCSSSLFSECLPHHKDFSGVGKQNLYCWLSSQRAGLSLLREGRHSRTWKSFTQKQWLLIGSASVLVSSFAIVQSTSADANLPCNHVDDDDGSTTSFSHGKKVFSDYCITGIAGDGRCLFRSVAHGACLRAGKPAPDENLQRKLADDLRSRVADEFLKRREETEWFIEGDFDSYISRIRKPHVWGGEPEILMATHVLGMPITVYMQDRDSGGVIAIAEYGQEYGKENPIRILYHGYGHYEALQIPAKGHGKSRL